MTCSVTTPLPLLFRQHDPVWFLSPIIYGNGPVGFGQHPIVGLRPGSVTLLIPEVGAHPEDGLHLSVRPTYLTLKGRSIS